MEKLSTKVMLVTTKKVYNENIFNKKSILITGATSYFVRIV